MAYRYDFHDSDLPAKISEDGKKYINEMVKEPWQEAWDMFVETNRKNRTEIENDQANTRSEMHELLGVC